MRRRQVSRITADGFIARHPHLLWWVDDAPQLSAMARKAIMQADGFVYVSLASVWELAIKVSLRKLRLALPVKQ